MAAEQTSINILFIENSATLRDGFQKQFDDINYNFSIASSYSKGIEKLQPENEYSHQYNLIVVGWPLHTDPSADELFAILEDPELSHIPVLVMSEESGSSTRTWVIRRPHTAVLRWSDHNDAAVTIQKLLSTLSGSQPVGNQPVKSALLEQKSNIRILFVDDSPRIRVYYRKLLKKEGYTVDVASCAAEALEKVKESTYDIAIIDYFMPDANGDVLVAKLNSNPATQNIATAIFASTYMDQVIEDSLNAGALDCLFKNEVDALFLARVAAMGRSVARGQSNIAEKQRLQSILNSVGDGVYGVNNDGRITFVNPMTRIVLGFNDDKEILHKSAYELFHHADETGNTIPIKRCQLQSAYGSKNILRSWETVFWDKEGNSVPVECTVYPLYIGDSLEGSVVAFKDITERKTLEERLRWQATHDSLTELFNRRYFEEHLEKEKKWLNRSRAMSAILYIDVDRFKYVNDTAGHTAGDHLLQGIGHRLRERLRETDILARLGGDEFAILLRNTDPEKVFEVADEFRKVVMAEDFEYCGEDYRIGISIGATIFDENMASPGNILAEADIACGVAKLKGGNQTHIYSQEEDYREELDIDLGWSNKLRHALDNDRFILRYQPMVPISDIDFDSIPDDFNGQIWDLQNAQFNGSMRFEALIRMIDKDDREILPGYFIPTAERFHLMPELDYWVLDNALKKLIEINEKWPNAGMSINVSGHTLCHKDFCNTVKRKLEEYSVNPDKVSFEITETTEILDMKHAQRVIHAIKNMGCGFSLDDFGTGFSSFSHLKLLPVDCVKIDGMFVQAMDRDPIDHAMVRSINDISRCLGRKTTAEYVESISTLKILRAFCVDYVQGYIIAQPLLDPVAEYNALPDNVHVMK